MATPKLDICPFEANICMSRGDSKTFGFNMFEEDGTTPRTITGFTYLLTVNVKKKPEAADPIVFQLTGTEVSPVVSFSPTDANTDITPKKYYFDVQEINGSGEKRTVIKGEFVIEQDITK